MSRPEPLLSFRDRSAPCPDCPASRLDAFDALLPRGALPCAFHGATLEARATFPSAWFQHHSYAIVRRGVLIRQRVDVRGRATSVDVIGPGGLFPLEATGQAGESATPTGYAVNDARLCLLSRDRTLSLVEHGGDGARDLLTMCEGAMERMSRLADARGRPGTEGRVAALLITLADTLSPSRQRSVLPADLRLTDLGGLAGLRHETVCRALKGLERRGLAIRTTDGIELLDRDLLERV